MHPYELFKCALMRFNKRIERKDKSPEWRWDADLTCMKFYADLLIMEAEWGETIIEEHNERRKAAKKVAPDFVIRTHSGGFPMFMERFIETHPQKYKESYLRDWYENSLKLSSGR